MKKIILTLTICLLSIASMHAQACLDIYYFEQLSCKDVSITFEQGVYYGVQPKISVAKFDSLNSVSFAALADDKLTRITDTVVGVDNIGRLFRTAVSDMPFKNKVWQPHWDSVSSKPTFHSIATSGSYNDLLNKPTIPNYTAGTGIGISGGVITNSAPDQTVSITSGNELSVIGTYPNFTVSKTKRQEAYSGTTSGSGTYTVTFGTAYSSAPNIQANIIGATDTQNIRITSISTTGFTVTVRNRTDVAGLLPTWSNVNGAIVDVLITEK